MILDFLRAEDGDGGSGKLSLSRLVYFMSFFPASYHIIATGQDVATYITTYTSGYLLGKHGGKIIEAIGNRSNGEKEVKDKDEGAS